MKYLLDANVFIEAHRIHYPFDVFPSFWTWLISENANGTLCSIDGVFDEIKEGNDELAEWVKSLDSEKWFLKCDDEATQLCYAELANRIAINEQFSFPAKEDFLAKADLWLIAKAKVLNYSLVTQERSNPNSKKKIFIPDVCRSAGANCINTIDLIRRLGCRF